VVKVTDSQDDDLHPCQAAVSPRAAPNKSLPLRN